MRVVAGQLPKPEPSSSKRDLHAAHVQRRNPQTFFGNIKIGCDAICV